LGGLIRRVREENIALIIRHPLDPVRDVEFLVRKTGAKVAVLAASVGDLPQARDYFSLFEANVAALVAAVAAGTP
jgi:ABC-type Zn uptake system ZnuABC Zn-binding protein ZnuA